jgi:mannose-6-phosphate isomerase
LADSGFAHFFSSRRFLSPSLTQRLLSTSDRLTPLALVIQTFRRIAAIEMNCLDRTSGRIMAVEQARARALQKPWGVVDLGPWYNASHDGNAIGEIWYERPDSSDVAPSLLLKLLFTSQPLSIQVHPDDAFARSMGLPNGKTEAWYVLSAAPDAKVALGLSRRLTPQQLRGAIDDGSISDLIAWRAVSADDVIFVPAGTIHAIGAGLVIAELQQRSDATFRLFDPGRHRELHVENAIVVAHAGPADFQVRSSRLTPERRLLVSNPHFVFERIDLSQNSSWYLEAERETWLLVLSGSAVAGSFEVAKGDALFAQSDRVDIHAGAIGMVGLVAYTGGGPAPHLLQRLTQPGPLNVGRPNETQVPTSLTQAKAAPKNGRLETTK